MCGLLYYIILKVPLAAFNAHVAEIFSIDLGYCIIVVTPSSHTKHLGLNLYPGIFFSFARISLKKLKNWAMSRGSLNGFPYWQGAKFFHSGVECPQSKGLEALYPFVCCIKITVLQLQWITLSIVDVHHHSNSNHFS